MGGGGVGRLDFNEIAALFKSKDHFSVNTIPLFCTGVRSMHFVLQMM